jgi:glutamate-5-semialdehyde dehydrogenase
MSEVFERVARLCRAAKDASAAIARADTATKDAALKAMAAGLRANAALLLDANARDLEAARAKGTSGAMLDRLALDQKRIEAMAAGLDEVRALPDPVGAMSDLRRRPNGLLVGRMRIPLGVVAMIYEARPNVTADAAGLTLKSGNAVILRGGSEAFHSNAAIAGVLRAALKATGLPEAVVSVVDTPDRAAVDALLTMDTTVDLVIPRGGAGLVRSVMEKSRIPVLAHAEGVCHVFVDAGADVAMATDIAINAKVQRPGVCNAMETLLVHAAIAPAFLPVVGARLRDSGVEIRGCDRTRAFLADATPAGEDDWAREYLDLILAVRVVDSLDEAMAHIRTYGSRHTEAIVTRDHGNAMRFVREVDSSLVLVNASTRFNDGNQLGLGAEIGISTTKVHAFGAMGLEELTTRKFVAFGDGQIRA